MQFSHEETILLMEAARIALCDADTFDAIAADTDTADSTLLALREKLTTTMSRPDRAYTLETPRLDGEALEREGDSGDDYHLVAEPGQPISCWIRAENISIHIRQKKEGVAIATYSTDCEADEELNEMFTSFARAEALKRRSQL